MQGAVNLSRNGYLHWYFYDSCIDPIREDLSVATRTGTNAADTLVGTIGNDFLYEAV